MDREIGKRYEKVMFLLAILSGVVGLATTFVPAFYVGLGIFGSYSDNLWILFLVILNGFTKGNFFPVKSIMFDNNMPWYVSIAFYMFLIMFVVMAEAPITDKFLKTRRNLYHKSTVKFQVKRMFGYIMGNVIVTALYFGIALYYCLTAGRSIVSVGTLLYIPLVAQIVLFIIGLYFKRHHKKAEEGLVAPTNAFANSSTFVSDMKADQNTVANDELDSAEMLIKYKELLDNGIITEDEYNKKKNDILNGGKKNE